MMRLTATHPKIPDWLKENLANECRYCGAPIVNDGANDAITQRYCPNPVCPGHMAERINYVAKYFNIKGIGPKVALTLIQVNNMQNHLESIPIFFPEGKPFVDLWEVGVLAMLYGVDTKWKDLTVGFGSFIDFFKANIQVDPIIFQNREYLIYCESFFNVRPPLSKTVLHVMITGSVIGYSNRNHYVADLNSKYGKYIQIIQVGKRQSNVDYLIMDSDASMQHPKFETALKANIPIVTSEEFTQKIINFVAYILMGRG